MPRRNAVRTDQRDPREFITVYVGVDIRGLIERVCNEEGRKISPYILHLIKQDMRTRNLIPPSNPPTQLPPGTLYYSRGRFGRIDPFNPLMMTSGGTPVRAMRNAIGNRLVFAFESAWITNVAAPRPGEIAFNEMGFPLGTIHSLTHDRMTLTIIASTSNDIQDHSQMQTAQATTAAAPVMHQNATRLVGRLTENAIENMEPAPPQVEPLNDPNPVIGTVVDTSSHTTTVAIGRPGLQRRLPADLSADQIGPASRGGILLSDTQGFNLNPYCHYYRMGRRGDLHLIIPSQAQGQAEQSIRICRETHAQPIRWSSQNGGGSRYHIRLIGTVTRMEYPYENVAMLNDNGDLMGIVVNRNGIGGGVEDLVLEHCRPSLFTTAPDDLTYYLQLEAGSYSGLLACVDGRVAGITHRFIGWRINTREDDGSELEVEFGTPVTLIRGTILRNANTQELIGEYLGPTTERREFTFSVRGTLPPVAVAVATDPLTTALRPRPSRRNRARTV